LRREYRSNFSELIILYDNYDSFTYNLRDYIFQHGAECIVIRNDEMSAEDILEKRPQGLVLSPGPGRPCDAGAMMQLIELAHKTIPILGICLGHQAIGEYFGAKLVRSAEPMHGKTSVITHDGSLLFKELPSELQVMRYHSLILEHIPEPLYVTATTVKNEVMAMSHKTLPLHSVQFHPESVLSEGGHTLIHNWLSSLNV
jgi:anthranilate synthase/aminodeoxychorismate synthase-like glutamine amidotransferase